MYGKHNCIAKMGKENFKKMDPKRVIELFLYGLFIQQINFGPVKLQMVFVSCCYDKKKPIDSLHLV